jgi:hypothetical protein
MSRGKLWTGLIVLFLAGTLTGVVGTCLYHQYERGRRGDAGPAARQARIMTRLTQSLGLTPAVQREVEPIVSRAYVDILQLQVQHQPEVEAIVTRSMADLKTKLSTEQQAQLDALYAQLQRRWELSRDYVRTTQRPAKGTE